MTTNNQISVEIPQTVINEVSEKLQECKTLLAPYLQALTPDERQSIFKMGDKTLATVEKIKTYLETNSEFAPAYMDKTEFLKDVAVAAHLTPLKNLVKQLSADLEDTVTLAGSEALTASLLYYGTVREAATKGVPTAKPIYEDLSKRFSKRGNKNFPEKRA
jgi:hypothetical protein